MGTKSGGDSCYANALPEERMFVLLSRDACSPETVRFWIKRRLETGKNQPTDAQIVEAEQCAKIMEEERDGIRSRLKGE